MRPSGHLKRMIYLTLTVHFFERMIFYGVMSAGIRTEVNPDKMRLAAGLKTRSDMAARWFLHQITENRGQMTDDKEQTVF